MPGGRAHKKSKQKHKHKQNMAVAARAAKAAPAAPAAPSAPSAPSAPAAPAAKLVPKAEKQIQYSHYLLKSFSKDDNIISCFQLKSSGSYRIVPIDNATGPVVELVDVEKMKAITVDMPSQMPTRLKLPKHILDMKAESSSEEVILHDLISLVDKYQTDVDEYDRHQLEYADFLETNAKEKLKLLTALVQNDMIEYEQKETIRLSILKELKDVIEIRNSVEQNKAYAKLQ